MDKVFQYRKIWDQYIKRLAQVTDDDNELLELADFSEFLTLLKPKHRQLGELVEHILTENMDPLKQIMGYFAGDALYHKEIAFDLLMGEATPDLVTGIAAHLDRIFQNALDNVYQDNLSVIKKIKAFTAKNKEGLSEHFIIDTIESREELPDNLRVELLQLLSKIKNTEIVDYSFWKDMEDRIPEAPLLGAVVIEALKHDHPWEALNVLLAYNTLDYEPQGQKQIDYFTYASRSAIYFLIRNGKEKDFRSYLQFESQLKKDWIKHIVLGILQQPQFRHLNKKIKEMRDREPSIKEEMIEKVPWLSKEAASDPQQIYDHIINTKGQITPLHVEILKDDKVLHRVVDLAISNLFHPAPNKEQLSWFRPIFFGLEDLGPDLLIYLRDKHDTGIYPDELRIEHLVTNVSFSFETQEATMHQVEEEMLKGEARIVQLHKHMSFLFEKANNGNNN